MKPIPFMDDLHEKLNEILVDLKKCPENITACQRVRVKTILLEKIAKNFRKASMLYYGKQKKRKNGRPRKVVKP